ncbi:MAG: Crp/Fnr family transcriptional regulator, partial [Sulfuriferula sp.]
MSNRKNKALCLDTEWIGHPKCETCAVRNVVLFSDLPNDKLNHLLQPVDNYHFHPGAHLYDMGTTGSAVFTIRSGMVKLEHAMPNGALRVVRLLHIGDVVGLEALVGDSYHHTAVALSDVDICRITTQTIHDLDAHSPQLHAQLMLRWQISLDEADDFILQLSTGSATARLARLLLKLSAAGMNELFVPPSRDDIGAMLGVTTETTSRLMAEFNRQGWVRTAGDRLLS